MKKKGSLMDFLHMMHHHHNTTMGLQAHSQSTRLVNQSHRLAMQHSRRAAQSAARQHDDFVRSADWMDDLPLYKTKFKSFLVWWGGAQKRAKKGIDIPSHEMKPFYRVLSTDGKDKLGERKYLRYSMGLSSNAQVDADLIMVRLHKQAKTHRKQAKKKLKQGIEIIKKQREKKLFVILPCSEKKGIGFKSW